MKLYSILNHQRMLSKRVRYERYKAISADNFGLDGEGVGGGVGAHIAAHIDLHREAFGLNYRDLLLG